jgi:chromosome segregation ATPase
MENLDANQLPGVDALPDGFVDSPTEPMAPLTPMIEQKKQPRNQQEDLSESDHSSEKTPKLVANTNPSETDNKQKAEGTLLMPQPVNFSSESPIGVAECSEAKEEAKDKFKYSERSGLETSETVEGQISSSDDSGLLKNKVISETKRKNVKRTFKSEKEFLEFTLMYQQVLTERDSAIAVRNKLESLCRELQRQNKLLMDECKRVASDGQNMRLELSGSFQVAIKEVSVKLEEQKNECLGQLKENEMLRTKLKHLADQYALSEQQYAQKLKQKTLELQIADLKMKQHEEKILQEQSQMKIYAEQVSQLLGTEKNLRLQLTSDGEKFQQFQEALAKSNEVFETFKQEIEKMTKSIKGLKKENAFLKSKSEKSDVTLIELVDEREGLKKQLEKTKNQKAKLESLCRSMQAERKEISAESNNTDSVPA